MLGITKHSLKAQPIITTIAGSGSPPNNYGYSGDGGYSTICKLYNPNGVTIDVGGNIYIADTYNNRIRKVNTLGIITTIAGGNTSGYSGDGGQATAAKLSTPTGIIIDSLSNLYITDFGNNVIRKVNTSGIISTVAGIGTAGYSGDGGQASISKLSTPRQMAFDTEGNLYFSDEGNYVIRKVNTAGIITTIAGNGTTGYSGDGEQATAAQLSDTYGLCFDKQNNLYIADGTNNVIRKVITSTGIITTIAGTGTQGYSGDGMPATLAELYWPADIKVDSIGNLYIADEGNNVIRKINTVGIISTIAGNDTAGFSGDGGSPILAQINSPAGLAFDTHDNLYIVDFNNQRIRKISHAGSAGIEQVAANSAQVTVWPNPTTNSIQVSLSGNMQPATCQMLLVTDVLGNEVNIPLTPLKGGITTLDVSSLSNGVYFVSLTMGVTISTQKIVVQR